MTADDRPVDEIGAPGASFAARQAAARRSMADGAPRTRPESAITAEALEWLNGQPSTLARKVHQSAFAGGGEPDIDACVAGRAVKIEMKRPGERPTRAQLARMRQWQRAGARVGWATCLQHVVEIVARVDDSWINPLDQPGAPPK